MARSTPARAFPFTSAFLSRTRRDGEAPRPEFPPIEQVAADLRRLRRISETLPKGTSFVRTIGVLHAYDHMLDIACRMLGVATPLLAMPDGKPRILERLRLEFELGECGLSF